MMCVEKKDSEGTDLGQDIKLALPLRDTLILERATNRSKDSWKNGLQLILELIPWDLCLITQNMTLKQSFDLI